MAKEKRQTSKDAHESIKAFKSGYYKKILDGLEKIKVGGNYEEIAKAAGIKDSQCWKRLSELERGGLIYNVGITRKLSSGRDGIVWQKTGVAFDENAKPDLTKPKPQKEVAQNPLFGI